MARLRLQKALYYCVLALTAAAVLDQLRLPKRNRSWTGVIFGIPYDFRSPGFHAGDMVGNPDDERLFRPRSFGVGWDLNLHALLSHARRLGQETFGQATTDLRLNGDITQEVTVPAAIGHP